MIKNIPEIKETQVPSLGWEDPLGEGNGYPLHNLVWRIPWTEKVAGYSPWSHKESDMTERLPLSLSHLWGFSR